MTNIDQRMRKIEEERGTRSLERESRSQQSPKCPKRPCWVGQYVLSKEQADSPWEGVGFRERCLPPGGRKEGRLAR